MFYLGIHMPGQDLHFRFSIFFHIRMEHATLMKTKLAYCLWHVVHFVADSCGRYGLLVYSCELFVAIHDERYLCHLEMLNKRKILSISIETTLVFDFVIFLVFLCSQNQDLTLKRFIFSIRTSN